jgi:hypothetical protein
VTTLMRGPERLREIVSVYLENEYPRLLAIARDQFDRQYHQLPDPAAYGLYEPYASARFPVVGMYVVSDRNHIRVDYSPLMEEQYEVIYATRIFVSVKTPDLEGVYEAPEYDWAVRCRDEMVAVLKACLLGQPSLGEPNECEIQEETLTTDYQVPVQAKTQSNRWIAAGVISVDIKLVESLYRVKIGDANTINVNPALLDG